MNHNIAPIILQVTLENGITKIYKETILDNKIWDLMTTISPEGEIILNKNEVNHENKNNEVE